MQTSRKSGDKWLSRIDLAAGGFEVLALPTCGPGTIIVAPAGGGTVLVEFTNSMPPADEADAVWVDALWAPAEGLGAGGVVSALVLETIPSTITAVRVTASAAGARIEIAQ